MNASRLPSSLVTGCGAVLTKPKETRKGRLRIHVHILHTRNGAPSGSPSASIARPDRRDCFASMIPHKPGMLRSLLRQIMVNQHRTILGALTRIKPGFENTVVGKPAARSPVRPRLPPRHTTARRSARAGAVFAASASPEDGPWSAQAALPDKTRLCRKLTRTRPDSPWPRHGFLRGQPSKPPRLSSARTVAVHRGVITARED